MNVQDMMANVDLREDSSFFKVPLTLIKLGSSSSRYLLIELWFACIDADISFG